MLFEKGHTEKSTYSKAINDDVSRPDVVVVIVSPSTSLVATLQQFLSLWGLAAVPGTVTDLGSLPLSYGASKNTVLVLDHILVGNGFEQQHLERLRRQRNHLRVLVAGHSETTDSEKHSLLQAGVSGYVALPKELHLLVKAIKVVATNGVWFERSVMAGAISKAFLANRWSRDAKQVNTDSAQQPHSVLTPRENVVASFASQGLRNREISQQLQIAEKTVKLHMTRIYRKLGISSRMQLVLLTQNTR